MQLPRFPRTATTLIRSQIIFFILFLLMSGNELASAQIKSSAPIVAIIDTGIDVNNQNLQKKLWQNSLEIPGNNIDDDNNGFIDDVYGWNFVSNNNKIIDFDDHGTHVASIIAPYVKDASLMILKYYQKDSSPKENFKNCLAAFRYAIANGAKIINFSGGGYGASDQELNLLRDAEKKGILVISAAGNDHINNDFYPYYPASYKLKNILPVGSLKGNLSKSSFSNYGEAVPIYAPGEEIIGWNARGQKILMSGTSQATAEVTGKVASFLQNHKLQSSYQAENLVAKILLTRSAQKQIAIDEISQLQDENVTAFGVKFSGGNSKEWILHTN